MPGDDNALPSEQMIVGVMCNSIIVISDLIQIQPDKHSGLQSGFTGIRALEYCLSISQAGSPACNADLSTLGIGVITSVCVDVARESISDYRPAGL